MTNRPEEKRNLSDLELNRETVVDIAEQEAEQARGGADVPRSRATPPPTECKCRLE